MERYTNKSPKVSRFNIIKRDQRFKKRIKELNNSISTLETELDSKAKSNNSYASMDIKAQLYDKRKKLDKLNDSYSKFKKRVMKIGAMLGVSLVLAGSTIAKNSSNKDFDTNFIEAGNSITIDAMDNNNFSNSESNSSYGQFKNNVLRYLELSNKPNLNHTEKDELSNIKSMIKSDPKNVNKLSLDILKSKIANSFGISDYSRLRIIDNSHSQTASQFTPVAGYQEDITISLDGETIASNSSFFNLSNGDLLVESNSIPKEVTDVLDEITKSQGKPEKFDFAYKALKSALNLDSNSLSFSKDVHTKVKCIENSKAINADNER